MLFYAFRHKPLIMVAIILADVIIAVAIGDRLLRWEIEQIRAAW